MLRWIILAVTVAGLTAAATLVMDYAPDSTAPTTPKPAVVREGPQPKIEVVGQPLFDFGTLPKHTQDKHTWQIKNAGQADLQLWLERTTCSCTIATLDDAKVKDSSKKKKVIVKPGESTTIDVGWDTKEWTTFDQRATLGTNDPSAPEVDLAIKGKVTPPIVVYPPQMVTFGNVGNEEKHTAKIALYSPDRPQTKITKVATSRPELIKTIVSDFGPEELKAFSTAKAGQTVTIEIQPGMPVGRFLEQMVVTTDHPKQTEVKISLTGDFTGPIGIVPSRLRMPAIASAKGGSGQVILLVRSGKPTKFEVTEKPEKLLVAVAPDEANTQKGRYRMTVTVPPGTSPGVVEGQILIKTDHPGAPELKVPVSVFVTRTAG